MSFTFPFSADQSGLLAGEGLGQYIEFQSVIQPDLKVRFKAFVTQFNPQFTSNWNRESVYGRMDPISTFQNTQRTIGLSFDAPAGTKEEAIENLAKVDTLIQMLYPTYDNAGSVSTISASPFIKVLFMNWISKPGLDASTAETSGLLCTLDGLTATPDLEVGVFQEKDSRSPEELERAGRGVQQVGFVRPGARPYIYPKVFKISCNLNVVHEDNPGQQSKFPYGYVDNPEPDSTRKGGTFVSKKLRARLRNQPRPDPKPNPDDRGLQESDWNQRIDRVLAKGQRGGGIDLEGLESRKLQNLNQKAFRIELNVLKGNQ